MSEKIVQLHDKDGNNIYPTTSFKAILDSQDLTDAFVQKSGDTITGNLTAPIFIGSFEGNATTATKLATDRTISLTGPVTGSGSFDGSKNLNIATTINYTINGKTLNSNITLSKSDIEFKPAGKSYLTFSSPNSFTLKVNDTTKHWNGTLEYFAENKTWTTWNGTTTLTSVNNDGEYVLYLRGTGNTVITGVNSSYKWVLTGTNISCIGNIEMLLDYATVESGNHFTMASNCYNSMFYGCTSLTAAPALPATTLADKCYYNMFYGCTSLTAAPALPATALTSDCYTGMFSFCTSLTQAPALPATTLANSCYSYMFQSCTGLTQAPALPATTLADKCYYNMFYACTSLTAAPALPATTLANSCYSFMFFDCTSLKVSTTQTSEYTQAYRISISGDGAAAANALNGMFHNTGGTFTGTPEINTTYYLSSNNIVIRNTNVTTLNGYVGSMINAIIGSAIGGSY